MINTSFCIIVLLFFQSNCDRDIEDVKHFLLYCTFIIFIFFLETTALKCVIERPTRRPTFDLLFEMKFLTPSSLNQYCVNVYVKEIVEHFKLLVQSNCTHPRPSEKIIADVKIGSVSNLIWFRNE